MKISPQGIYYQYIENPNKPTVVLAHPLGMSMRAWDYVVPDLSEDYSVLRFDLPGHGNSLPYGQTLETLDDTRLLTDLLSLCDTLGIAKFHFVGTSIGGVIGQQLLAYSSERLLSATLTNTGLKIGTLEGWLDRQSKVNELGLETMASTLVTRWFSAHSVDRYPNLLSHWESVLAKTDDHSYGLLCAWLGNQDMSNTLGEVNTPVLLIAGADDVATPTSDLTALGNTIGTSVVELEQTGHVPSVESSRDFAKLLRKHLAAAN